MAIGKAKSILKIFETYFYKNLLLKTRMKNI